jgi:hypothetical protein
MSGNNHPPPIDQYCKDPSKFANKYSKQTLDYWQQFCDSRKGQQQENISTDIKKIGEGLVADLASMIENMFQPESLKMISAYLGVDLGPKILRNMLAKGIEWKIPEEVAAKADELAVKGISKAALNASMVTDSIISAAVRDGTDDMVVYSFAWIAKGLELFSSLVNPLVDVLTLIQIYGMIFDAWDPCHLSDELNASQINLYNSNFNQVFRENISVALDTITDGYGNVIFINKWPITFYADNGIIDKVMEDKYAPLRMAYMARYLNSLKINSYGQKICWPTGGNLVESTVLDKAIKSLSMFIANDNTVVAKGIEKYIPVILAIFFGGILLLIIKYLIK